MDETVDSDRRESSEDIPEAPKDHAGTVSEQGPKPFLGAVDLFFRPAAFFPTLKTNRRRFLVCLAVIVFGWSCSIQHFLMGLAKNLDEFSNWAEFFGYTFGAGLFVGAIYYVVAGWWYGIRMKWSGILLDKSRLPYRMCILVQLIWALPRIVLSFVNAEQYPAPLNAMNASHPLEALLVVFLMWSIWNSYRGVRSFRPTKRGIAVVCFLVLPLVSYGILIGAGVALARSLEARNVPGVMHPRFHENQMFSFQYPGNWRTGNTTIPAELGVEVLEMDITGVFVVRPNAASLSQVMRALIDEFENRITVTGTPEVFDSWGSFQGIGRTIPVTGDGVPGTIRVFLSTLPGERLLFVQEAYSSASADLARMGFELIESTFKIKRAQSSPLAD